MIQEKVIKNLLLLGVGVAKYFRVSMGCPMSRFPIRIIVFNELELIIFVSQGLTLFFFNYSLTDKKDLIAIPHL